MCYFFMDLKEKLALEKPDENLVRLYHEGIFYVAYNHSALRFVNCFAPDTKILKHIRKDGSWYLRVGLVHTSPKLEAFHLCDEQGSWLDNVNIVCEVSHTSLEDCVPHKIICKATDKIKSDRILQKDMIIQVTEEIKSINLGTLTPVQALLMIEGWQRKLNEGR